METKKFYCLSSDGSLYALGNHDDWEMAEATAHAMQYDPIWTFGEDTMHEWQRTLNVFRALGE